MTQVMSSAKTETYRKNLKMGIIKTKTMQLLNFVKENPNCNTDKIRVGLNMPHQTATAIISNLLDEGIIKIIGDTKVKNSTFSNYLFVEDYREEEKLKKARHLAKFKLWMEQGLSTYDDEMTITFLTYLISEYDYFKLTNK
jgi:predicted HTH transcriptional regulator